MSASPRVGEPDPSEHRRAFRAFARAHHPDLGGDPAVFVAGLDAWRGSDARRLPAEEVVYFRHRHGPAVVIGWWRDRRARRRRPPRVS